MAAFYTLLYVAPSSHAESIAVDAGEDANERYPTAWLRHIGDEELVAVWDILEDEASEGTLMGNLTYVSPDGDVMVMTVPERFVRAMDNVSQGDLELLAQEWLSSSLMMHWALPDAIAVLEVLKDICRQSLDAGLPILQVASL